VTGSVEWITVVDDADRPRDTKARGTIGPSDIFRVTCVWLLDGQGHVVIGQRAAGKSHDPLRWGPIVAGTVRSDESYAENVARECGEEIGWQPARLTEGPKVFINTGHRRFYCQWFETTIDETAMKSLRLEPVDLVGITAVSHQDLFSDVRRRPDRYVEAFEDYIEPFFSADGLA
jgi:isopentenyldiphosphate isomerase